MKEIITQDDILELFEGQAGNVSLGLTPIQTIGMKLAEGVGLLVSIVTLLLIVGWMVFSFRQPSQSEVALENTIKLFDCIVAKVLVPIFTLIIGYLFGKRDR